MLLFIKIVSPNRDIILSNTHTIAQGMERLSNLLKVIN